MQMDFRLAAKVEGQDGQKLGEIKHLVMKPGTKEIGQIVVGDGTRLRKVDVAKVGKVNSEKDTVQLSLSKEQFNQLPEFDEKSFMESRDYNDEDNQVPAVESKGGSEGGRFVTGGYSHDPDTSLEPPGLVNPPKNT